LNKVITQRRKSKDQDKDFVSVSLRRLSKELSTKLGFVDHSTHPSPASPYSLSDEQDEGYGGYGEDYSDGSFNEDGFNEDNIYDNADVNHRNHRERYTGNPALNLDHNPNIKPNFNPDLIPDLILTLTVTLTLSLTLTLRFASQGRVDLNGETDQGLHC
jgi:hypothetical protein